MYLKSIFKEKIGSNRLGISNTAHDQGGRYLTGCSSLHDSESADLGDFWKIFEDLDKTKKVTISLTMDQQEKGKLDSRSVFGKENLSGYIQSLIQKGGL